MPSIRLTLAGASLALGVFVARPAGAQSTDGASAPDESPSRWPLAVWGSAGLGVGNVRSNTRGQELAATLRLSGSAGPVILTYRDNDIGSGFAAGDGVRDRGILLGARTPDRGLFGSAAIGYASAVPRFDCENCGSDRNGPSAGVLAYDLMAHANFAVLGLAIGLSGTAGPAKVSYTAVTVHVELGWFGR